MKHLSIYNIEKKKAVFESDVKEYEISSYNDSTEFDITTCDDIDFHIKLRNDIKYAISIMNLTGDKNE